MTISDINTLISEYTGVDTNAFTNTTRAIYLTEWLNKVVTMIWQSQDDWLWDDTAIGTYPIVTRSLVAGRRDYLFSTAAWSTIGVEGGAAGSDAAITPVRIRRVDVCYDGVGNTCYKAEQISSSQIPDGLGNTTDEDSYFSSRSPYYELRDGGIWLYPTATAANVTNSGVIRVEFDRNPTAITSAIISTGTLVPPFDASFHKILALGVARDWGVAHGRDNVGALSQLLQEEEFRLKQHYGSKSVNDPIVLKAVGINYN